MFGNTEGVQAWSGPGTPPHPIIVTPEYCTKGGKASREGFWDRERGNAGKPRPHHDF